MGKHVMECLGLSRVTIEDGKVVEVTEPRVKRCPIFEKYRGIKELTPEAVKQNIEYRMGAFGMCTDSRETSMKDFLSFGVSETLSTGLSDGVLDAVVLAADGCGTAVVTQPDIVQGLGGRISGIRETTPIAKVIEAVGPENVLDPEKTPIDMIAGVEKAYAMGYRKVAVTTASVAEAEEIRGRHKDAVIALVHTSGTSPEDAAKAFEVCDIITACASKNIRAIAKERKDLLIAGSGIPVLGVTEAGKKLIERRLEITGKKPWDPSQKEDPPSPLI